MAPEKIEDGFYWHRPRDGEWTVAMIYTELAGQGRQRVIFVGTDTDMSLEQARELGEFHWRRLEPPGSEKLWIEVRHREHVACLLRDGTALGGVLAYQHVRHADGTPTVLGELLRCSGCGVPIRIRQTDFGPAAIATNP